jgi:ribosomal protein S15P/S13E
MPSPISAASPVAPAAAAGGTPPLSRDLADAASASSVAAADDRAAQADAALAAAEERVKALTAEVARLRRELGREKEDHASCLGLIRKIEDVLTGGGHKH